MKNQEAERGEGTPTDLLSPEIIIEQPAPINEIPEGNDGICLGCLKKDNDVCLQDSPHWGPSYTCTNSKQWCSSWGKDMRRCCPNICNSGQFTEEDCNSFSCGSESFCGTCEYPIDLECRKLHKLPETLKRNI